MYVKSMQLQRDGFLLCTSSRFHFYIVTSHNVTEAQSTATFEP